MSIYLAWSVYKLVAVFVWIVIFSLFMMWIAKKVNFPKGRKAAMIFATPASIITLLTAFNIGDRQQELGRSNFNASAPQTVDKIETNQQNVDSVKQAFEQTVKK